MPKKGEKKQVKTAKSKVIVAENSGRRIRKATRKQAKLKAKKEARTRASLPGSFKLTWQSLSTITKFWKSLFGIVLVYSLLNLIFVSGLIDTINSTVSDIQTKHNFSNAATGFGSLLSSSGGNNASAAQSLLLVLESLVIIWALRHLLGGEKVSIKQSYYQSMTPLIPFLIVILVVILQLLPFTLGSAGLSLALSNALADSTLTGVLFGLLFAALAYWSFYMVSSSIFAIYIVTLPDMQPRRALGSAKNLARFRRFAILRKILFLPLFILLIMGLIIIPLIMFASFLVMPTFFILTMLAILYAHTYLYGLYKGLLT